MSEQEHIQKKSPNELNQSEQSRFSTRGFAEQIGQDIASKQPQDIKTQLSRAERFGHNLSKMPVPTSPPPLAALQTKAPASGGGNQVIQQAEDDELQMKSATPAQSTQSQPLQRKTSNGSVSKMNSRTALPIQHSTEPVRDSGGSMLKEISSIDNPSMDMNAYKSLNQHVELLLPKLQQQAMQQKLPGDTQAPMQFKGGGGGKKGGGKKGGGKK